LTASIQPVSPTETKLGVMHPVSHPSKTRVLQPIEVAERVDLGPAERLNLISERVGILPPRGDVAAIRRGLALIDLAGSLYQGIHSCLNTLNDGFRTVPTHVSGWVAKRRGLQPIRVFEDLYGGSGKTREQQTKVVTLKPSFPAVSSRLPEKHAVTSFGPMEGCPSLYFAGNLDRPAPQLVAVTKVPASRPTPPASKATSKPAPATISPAPAPKIAVTTTPTSRPTAQTTNGALKPAPADKPQKVALKATATAVQTKPPRSSWRPIEDSSQESDLEVASIIPLDDGFGTFVAQPTVKKPPAPVIPHFEPLVVGEVRLMGVAYELNRRNDGQGPLAATLVKPQPAKARPDESSPDLSRAVKLTRDALFAWVNVLSRPAVVTVSQPLQRF
jgi:hypothetical protein